MAYSYRYDHNQRGGLCPRCFHTNKHARVSVTRNPKGSQMYDAELVLTIDKDRHGAAEDLEVLVLRKGVPVEKVLLRHHSAVRTSPVPEPRRVVPLEEAEKHKHDPHHIPVFPAGAALPVATFTRHEDVVRVTFLAGNTCVYVGVATTPNRDHIHVPSECWIQNRDGAGFSLCRPDSHSHQAGIYVIHIDQHPDSVPTEKPTEFTCPNCNPNDPVLLNRRTDINSDGVVSCYRCGWKETT